MTAATSEYLVGDMGTGDLELSFSTTTRRPTGHRGLSMSVLDSPSMHEKSGLASCIFNFTNYIIGAGIIGLPYALSRAGFYVGVILLILVALLTDWSVRNLIDCGRRKNRMDYELIVEDLFGKCGYYVVICLMFLLSYGAMISYHIIV